MIGADTLPPLWACPPSTPTADRLLADRPFDVYVPAADGFRHALIWAGEALPDADRHQLHVDGWSWRRLWLSVPPELHAELQDELRSEMDRVGDRLAAIESSHRIAALLGRVGPSRDEMRRRRLDGRSTVTEWVTRGPDGHINYPGRMGEAGAA